MKWLLPAVLLASSPAWAAKNVERNFPVSCDEVWTAAMKTAKGQHYRIVSVSKDEHIISVVAGGAFTGERILTLSIAPGAEHGCDATVQSAYSGIVHSDAPDLIERLAYELISPKLDHGSKAFKHFKNCEEYSSASAAACEKHLQKDLAKERPATNSPDSDLSAWWKNSEAKP